MKNYRKNLKWNTYRNIAFAAIFATLTINASAQTVSLPLAQPGYYHMALGDIDLIALSDGSVSQDMGKLLTNVKPGEVKSLFNLSFQEPVVELSVNAYLFKLDGKLILIDAGTSELFGPTLGKLPESFAKAGFKPEDVDAVLITHIHSDHTGGLMLGEKMVFPNATIYVSQQEYDFWLTPKNYKAASAELKPYFDQALLKMSPYVKAGKVKTFNYGKELFPGVLPIASPGHTPGHSFYKLSSKNESIVFWGDIMHAAPVQFSRPNVTIVYDINPNQAAAARKKAFADAAKNKYWIASDHLSFPGIGHIRAEGTGYKWYPVNYSTTGHGQ
ncbi:MBL fold metallo-hydrolase [Mucilaginibacter sp.]|uniref:MBL fold metallo-hydrolase n=1 Tax=Mucilaginibacter sp. TaxID=1882438 RepID=UPI0032670F91